MYTQLTKRNYIYFVCILIFFWNHHQHDDSGGGWGYAPDCAGTIVELAVGTPDLSTLVAAVTAADLVGTLSGDGPFTVFGMYNIIPVPCMMSMSYSLVIRDSNQLAFILVYA